MLAVNGPQLVGFDRNGFAGIFADCGPPYSLWQTGGCSPMMPHVCAALGVVFVRRRHTPDRDRNITRFGDLRDVRRRHRQPSIPGRTCTVNIRHEDRRLEAKLRGRTKTLDFHVVHRHRQLPGRPLRCQARRFER